MLSNQLYRRCEHGEVVAHETITDRGKVGKCNGAVPVEAYEKREVCICLMSEGFDPQPPQRIHNNWCTYVEPTDG